MTTPQSPGTPCPPAHSTAPSNCTPARASRILRNSTHTTPVRPPALPPYPNLVASSQRPPRLLPPASTVPRRLAKAPSHQRRSATLVHIRVPLSSTLSLQPHTTPGIRPHRALSVWQLASAAVDFSPV